jgi:hypothetical protein
MALQRAVEVAAMLPPALLAIGILILAGPTRLAPPEQERVQSNIQFVLDVSGSMRAPFGSGTRADAAIRAFQEDGGSALDACDDGFVGDPQRRAVSAA